MKAEVIVNRHIVAANKKSGRDDLAISVQTSAGKIYCKEIETVGKIRLVQDADHPRSCGATIWLEGQVEELVIDGKPGMEALAQLKTAKQAKKTKAILDSIAPQTQQLKLVP